MLGCSHCKRNNTLQMSILNLVNFLQQSRIQKHGHVRSSILTTLHCAAFRWQPMQNHLCMHHLIRSKLHCWGMTPTQKGYVPLVHHGAQHRSVVHNAGRWCTTQLCTIGVMHNAGSTNTCVHPPIQIPEITNLYVLILKVKWKDFAICQPIQVVRQRPYIGGKLPRLQLRQLVFYYQRGP